MFKKLKQPKDGFTIIEVLIVLAIAALILLIVFLAVPALQRSSRNTQRKNDAAAVGGAVANYISNNGGSLPSLVAGDGSSDSNAVFSSAATSNTETAKLGYYTVDPSAAAGPTAGNISIANVTTTTTPTLVDADGATPGPTQVSTEQIVVLTGEACDDTGTQGGTVNTRTAAIFYVTESGSGLGSLQCIEQ